MSPFRFETCELNASLDTHPYPHGGHFEQLPSNGYCPCPASRQNCSSYSIVVNSGIDMDALIVWAETADGERVGRWDIGHRAGSYAMYEHASGSAGQPCPGAPNSTIENNQLLHGYAHTIRWFPPTTAVGNITFNGMWQTSSSSRPGTYHFNPATMELNSHPACALTAEPTQPPPTPPPPTAAPVSPFRFETCELNASLDTHPYPHGGHFEQLPSNGYCPCPASRQNCSSYSIVVNSGIDMDALIVWAETADGERVGRWDIGHRAGSYAMYEHASGSAGQPCPGAPNSTIENNQLLHGYAHTIRWFPPTTAVGNITFNGMWQTSSSSRPGTYHFNPATMELNSHPACALTAEPTQPPPTPPVSTTTMQPMTCARNCGQAVRGGGTCRANGRCTSCNSNRVLQSGRCYQSLSCKGRRIQTGSTAGAGCRCLQDQCHWCTRSAAGDICRVVSGLLR